MSDETSDLVQALLVVDEAITRSRGDTRRLIVESYADAQACVLALTAERRPPAARVKACFARYKVFKDADDVAAIGWLLTAAQERIAQKNLPAWPMLDMIAGRAARKLTVSRHTLN